MPLAGWLAAATEDPFDTHIWDLHWSYNCPFLRTAINGVQAEPEPAGGPANSEKPPDGMVAFTLRCDNLEFFGDGHRARQWASRALRNTWLMARLRVLLRQEFLTFATDHDDEQLVVEVARLLSIGRLHLHRKRRERIESEVGAVVEAVPAEEVVAPKPAAPAPVEKPAPPPEEPMFAESVDPEQLAEVQKKAAKLGVPFCEECQKARLAAERQEFPESIDAVALAEAQKNAAERGVPFCEECMKAQLEQAREETPEFSPQVDAAALAAAQQSAAQHGIPFCEECQKARLEQESQEAQQAQAAQEASEFSPQIDAAALADNQRSAAQEGVPFCEECEKAAAKQS